MFLFGYLSQAIPGVILACKLPPCDRRHNRAERSEAGNVPIYHRNLYRNSFRYARVVVGSAASLASAPPVADA